MPASLVGAADMRCAGALVLVVALACAPAPSMSSRVLVHLGGGDAAEVHGAVLVLEEALAGVPGVSALRSTSCADGGVLALDVKGAPGRIDAVVEAARDAIQRVTPRLPRALPPPVVSVEGDVVAAFAVRGADPFSARAFVDATLAPTLARVPGVSVVDVRGGRRERRVRLEPERLLAAGVSLPAVLSAMTASSDLEKTVVKTAPLVRLTDLATLGEEPAGEPLRRDGAVEVVVRGHAPARGRVRKAARGIAPPAGIEVAALDDRSDEGVALLLSGDVDADVVADVQRVVLGVPGVHLWRPAPEVQLTLDRERLAELAVDPAAVARAMRTAGDGLVIDAAGEPVRVVLGALATPEALLSIVVADRGGPAGGPVRLFDVARASIGAVERKDRLDRAPVVRLRTSFDAGVRKNALDQLERDLATWSRAHPAVRLVLERERVAATFDAVCP